MAGKAKRLPWSRVPLAAVLLALTACVTTAPIAGVDGSLSDTSVVSTPIVSAPTLTAVAPIPERSKMMRANQALAAKDYALARALAIEAQADARLAQSKANVDAGGTRRDTPRPAGVAAARAELSH
jgi:hypothetical protein